MNRRPSFVSGLAAAVVFAAPLAAQQPKTPAKQQAAAKSSFDRRIVPTPGKVPDLTVPFWGKVSLANGAQLVVSEKRGLPLVSFQISFIGGANQYEPEEKPGLANFVANMLSEGTTHRNGDQISNDLQLLGTEVNAFIGGESGRVSFESTRDKFAATLAVLADLLENPTFPQDALDRLRARTIVSLTVNRDRTSGIANVVFPKSVFGTAHPYGRSMNEASVKAITRDDLVAFYKNYFRPGHAVISVVGDISQAEAKRAVENALSGWKAGGSVPDFSYPAAPSPKPTTIYLVDKPGAAQSTFALGEVGPPRATPDYFALRVMNEMLGVLFQSRLNHNIREVKGYSYGVGSSFGFGKGPGAFRAGGDIVTAKTDSALIEFMKELRDIRGRRPPSDDELAQAKASLVQSLPSTFASVTGVNNNIASIYTQGLAEDYYQAFARAVNAVTREDVVRVAQKYIDPEHLTIVIVGDRSKIEAPLIATKIAPIVVLDVNGDPVKKAVTP
ncbi:MAG TPA: pitrilysin family protein [Gemmatimonadaceae bacterium]|jgi:predicted Zn-dependent peptidase|nr:pitrilysin family protein [Gemmatimonadaceae bacterium]